MTETYPKLIAAGSILRMTSHEPMMETARAMLDTVTSRDLERVRPDVEWLAESDRPEQLEAMRCILEALDFILAIDQTDSPRYEQAELIEVWLRKKVNAGLALVSRPS